MKKNGFISMTVVFTFFIAFILLMILILSTYANKRIKLKIYKEDIRNTMYSQDSTDECNLGNYEKENGCSYEKLMNFDNSGTNVYFSKVPCDGYYLLEVWGAQGGNKEISNKTYDSGGFGGYTKGLIYLKKDNVLYYTIGGQGGNSKSTSDGGAGGFNGGGHGGNDDSGEDGAGGGGATHVSYTTKLSGELKNMSQGEIVMVAGGGAGGAVYESIGESIKVYRAKSAVGHIKNHENLLFGQGQSAEKSSNHAGTGGGGGWYGGLAGKEYEFSDAISKDHNKVVKANNIGSGTGGSGYFNSEIKCGVMYCYDCEEWPYPDEKTVSVTTTIDDSRINDGNYAPSAKQGNGFAKITYIGEAK